MTTENITHCSVEGCDKPRRKKEYCGMHYERLRRNGSLDLSPPKVCLVDGCESRRYGHGYCSKHYQRFMRNGNPLKALRNRGEGTTLEERFWSRVDKTPGLGRDGDCWEWTGYCPGFGYGVVGTEGRHRQAHIMAWFLTKGIMPTLQLLHSCDNPPCVNPAHLREGTQADNVRDAVERNRVARGRQIHKNAVDEDVVRRAQILFAQGYSRKEVMQIENIGRHTAKSIDAGLNYKWVT